MSEKKFAKIDSRENFFRNGNRKNNHDTANLWWSYLLPYKDFLLLTEWETIRVKLKKCIKMWYLKLYLDVWLAKEVFNKISDGKPCYICIPYRAKLCRAEVTNFLKSYESFARRKFRPIRYRKKSRSFQHSIYLPSNFTFLAGYSILESSDPKNGEIPLKWVDKL